MVPTIYGTAGNLHCSDTFKALEEIFYNPEVYKLLEYKKEGISNYFIPAYMKREKRSTLGILTNNMSIKRRTGNTTRQVDFAIQLLYEGYIVVVQDHWDGGTNHHANDHLFRRIIDRFQTEFRNDYKRLCYDKNALEIYLATDEDIYGSQIDLGLRGKTKFFD